MHQISDACRIAHDHGRHRNQQLLYDMLSITRRINLPPDRLADVLQNPKLPTSLRSADVGASGWLVLTECPTPSRSIQATWRGRGRLHGGGLPLVRSTRVEIEISVWSAHACELRLRPTSRHATRWGRRRLRRYVELAHRTGDRFTSVISDLDPSRQLVLPALCEPTEDVRRSGEDEVAA